MRTLYDRIDVNWTEFINVYHGTWDFLIRLEDFRSVFNHLTWCFRGSVMLSPCTWHDGFNVIWRSKSSTIHPEFPPRDLRARHPSFLWNSLDMFFGNGPRHFKTCLLICSLRCFPRKKTYWVPPMDQALVKEEEEEEDVATGGLGAPGAGETSRSRDMGWCPYSYGYIMVI